MTHSETLYPNHSFINLAEKLWTLRARLDRYHERHDAEHFSTMVSWSAFYHSLAFWLC